MTFWQHMIIFPIRLYKIGISPFLPPRCRFYPSCSAYAVEAIATHGVLRGAMLTGKRLLRCHPGTEGGSDPVPSPFSKLQDRHGH